LNWAVGGAQGSVVDLAVPRGHRLIPVLIALLAGACLAGAGLGAFPLSPLEILAILMDRAGLPAPVNVTEQQAAVLLSIRLPRVLLAALTGAGLGLAGAAMQGLFRNPLADPGLLGVSSGASLGACIAIVFGWAGGTAGVGQWTVPLGAFACGSAVTLLVYRMASREGHVSLPLMLLAGIAVNALTGAVIGLLISLADDTQLRDFTFWSLGSLARADWRGLGVMTPLIAIGGGLLWTQATTLNALLLGETEALHLGIDPKRLKRRIILPCALIVGALVSMTGGIGFVSLVAPHLIRLVAGPDHRRVLPGAALGGASLLVLADLAARTVTAPAEIPVGIVTALLGTPLFLWLLAGKKDL
jgi:iron complex transport system permease protein